MAILESKLKATLLDNVSGAARQISASLFGIGRAANGAGKMGLGAGLQASTAGLSASLAAAHAKILAVSAALYAINRQINATVDTASAFETRLLDIAQKADLSDTAMGQLGKTIRALAKDVGRGANDIAGGVDTLMGFGLDEKNAMAVMPAVARAATAYNAQVQDLAKATYASLDNLKVPAHQMAAALDAMAYSGKQGAFEIKDMAAEFPALTAGAQALKMTGVDAVAKLTAALQVARKGAATGSEAATNVANLMQKIQAEDAVKKWKKLGVDIRKEVKKTQDAGGDVFVMLADKIQKVLKGDLGKLGDLYQDAQVQQFLRPLIQNLEEYKRIRDGALNNSGGTVNRDFERRMKTHAAALNRFKGAAEDVKIALGNLFLPGLTKNLNLFAETLNTLDQRVGVFDHIGKAFEGLAKGLGFEGGGDMMSRLRDSIFGSMATFEQDVDRLTQTFMKFREIGESLRAVGDAMRDFVQAFSAFAGLDGNAVISTLGTLAGYAAGLTAAAIAIGAVAKSLRFLGRALLFVTGIKAATSLIGSIAALGGGAAVAAGATATAAKTVARSKVAGGVAKIGGRLAGPVGAALTAYDVIEGINNDPRMRGNAKAYFGIDPADWEASRRRQDFVRRDPEAARGEAFRKIGADTGGLDVVGTKADEAKEKLDGLNTTVTPNVNTEPVQKLGSLLDEVQSKLDRINGSATAARKSVASLGGSVPSVSSPGRGRSDVASATAALSRSRETNQTDRDFA